jgi:hypothetical protein
MFGVLENPMICRERTVWPWLFFLLALACEGPVADGPVLPNKMAVLKTAPDEGSDEDEAVSTVSVGSSGEIPAFISSQYRLKIGNAPKSPATVKIGEAAFVELTGQTGIRVLAQNVANGGIGAVDGFVKKAWTVTIDREAIRSLLGVLACFPEETEIDCLIRLLKPGNLGHLARWQLYNIGHPAFVEILARIHKAPERVSNLAYQVVRSLLNESNIEVTRAYLRGKKSTGRKAIFSLIVSVDAALVEREIDQQMIFGTFLEKAELFQILRAANRTIYLTELHQYLVTRTLDRKQFKNLATMKRALIKTLAQFGEFSSIPYLIELLEGEALLQYESLKALNGISQSTRTKTQWLDWWVDYEEVLSNVDGYCDRALNKSLSSEVRIECIKKMTGVRASVVNASLRELFKDRDASVRLFAIQRSASYKRLELVGPLAEQLNDTQEKFVWIAHWALQRITGKNYGRSKVAWDSYINSRNATRR